MVGSADYSRLENAAGVTALWDLNKILLRAGYDHLNYLSLRDDTGSQPDGRSDMTSLSAGYAPAAGLLFGVEVGGGLIHYEAGRQQGFEDASQWNAGVFTDTQISEYIRLRGSVGYVLFSPDPLPTAPDLDEFSGLYCQLALIHRLNEYVTYTLSGGRNVSFTFYGGTIDLYQARLAANWRCCTKSVSTRRWIMSMVNTSPLGRRSLIAWDPPLPSAGDHREVVGQSGLPALLAEFKRAKPGLHGQCGQFAAGLCVLALNLDQRLLALRFAFLI